MSILAMLLVSAFWRMIRSPFSGVGPLNPIDGMRLNFHTIRIVMRINRITQVNHTVILIVTELMYPQTRSMYYDTSQIDMFVAL